MKFEGDFSLNILSKNKLKYFRSLKIKKYRLRENKVLVEGVKLCQEAIRANLEIDAFLFYPRYIPSEVLKGLIATCQLRSIPYYEITPAMLKELSETIHSQGVICVLHIQESYIIPENAKLILALNAVNDPGNLGTIIRTADWFGVDAILLSEDSVELYNSKVIRSTMGSIFHLPILKNINLGQYLEQLKSEGFILYAADLQGAHNFNEINFNPKSVLVVGNESHGISSDILKRCDMRIKIPAKGKAESLNMAVATGIILSRMGKL